MTSHKMDRDFGWDQVDPFDQGDRHLWMKIEHLGHYLFASDFLKGKSPDLVADISCGLGYGIPELLRAAKDVIGVDGSPEMIHEASRRCDSLSARFVCKDIDREDLAPEIEDGSLDAVACFETLEHLADPEGAVARFSRALKPGGFLICSVPSALYEPRGVACLPRNVCHKNLFSFASLRRLVEGEGMVVLYRLGQSWSYTLLKREQTLWGRKAISRRLSDLPEMHTPEVIRLLSYIMAYPTVEDVDGSYSMIIVARKGD